MADKSVEHNYQWKNVGNQYIAVLTASLMNICSGFAFGWMTPMIPILMAPNAPLINGPLDNEEISWITAVFAIGSVCGSFLSLCLMPFVGSKHSTALIVIPSIGFSLFSYYGNTFTHIFIGRVLGGIAIGATQSTIVIYTSEISNDDIRGRLSSFGALSRNTGVLFCLIVSTYLGYEHMSTVNLILSIVFLAVFVFLPNTPQFYLRKQQYENAEKALKFYKGYTGNNEAETIAFTIEFERIKNLAEKAKDNKNLRFDDFCTKQALRGLIIAVVVVTLLAITANRTVMTYAVPVFEQSGSQIDPYISSMLIPVMLIAGCSCSTQLADKLGRKFMIVVSMAGCGLGLAAFAGYSYASDLGYDVSSFHWFPVAVILFSSLVASVGVIPLASLCAVESLPPKIRGVGLGISLIAASSTSFVSLKTFPIWMEAIGLPFTFLIYAVGCALGAIFVLVFVTEMTGKRIDEDR